MNNFCDCVLEWGLVECVKPALIRWEYVGLFTWAPRRSSWYAADHTEPSKETLCVTAERIKTQSRWGRDSILKLSLLHKSAGIISCAATLWPQNLWLSDSYSEVSVWVTSGWRGLGCNLGIFLNICAWGHSNGSPLMDKHTHEHTHTHITRGGRRASRRKDYLLWLEMPLLIMMMCNLPAPP